jgi:hypothetical protein
MITHRFDPGNVLRKINEAEQRFPVNNWNVNGLAVWPFIRTSLAYSQNKNPNTKKTKQYQPIHKRIIRLVRTAWFVPFEYLRIKKHLKEAVRLFVGNKAHRSRIDGMLINKYFDSAILKFKAVDEKSIVFETYPLFKRDMYMNKNQVHSLWFLYAFFEFRERLVGRRRQYHFELAQYDDFFEFLMANFEHKDTIRKSFSRASIKPRLAKLYQRKEGIKKMLSDSKIKHAYFLCYYSGLLYPVIAACNELNIPTTDIQHGGQGFGHYSYDNWSASPADGYALLPRYFWNWDQNSADVINQWTKRTAYHRAFSIGNPWTEDSIEFYKESPRMRDYVLVNMNEIVLEEFIVESILHFGDKMRWMLRMHPRTYQNKGSLETQLKERGIDKYAVVEDSTSIPITQSILHCAHFISKPSGSIIEAISLGVKPIFIKTHIKYYDHYIESGEVAVIEQYDAKELITLLEQMPANTPEKGWERLKRRENKYLKFESVTTT